MDKMFNNQFWTSADNAAQHKVIHDLLVSNQRCDTWTLWILGSALAVIVVVTLLGLVYLKKTEE